MTNPLVELAFWRPGDGPRPAIAALLASAAEHIDAILHGATDRAAGRRRPTWEVASPTR